MDTVVTNNETGGITEAERKAIEERIRLEMKIRQEYEAALKEQEILNNLYTSDLPEKIIEEHVLPKMKETCDVLHGIDYRVNEINGIKNRQSTLKHKASQPGFRLHPILSFLLYTFEVGIVYLIIGLPVAMFAVMTKREVNLMPFLLLSLILPPILSAMVKSIIKKSRNKRLKKEYDELEKKRKPLENQLMQYVKDKEEIYSFLPEKYQTSFAADFVYRAFAEHRAQSMKEAFNQLEGEVKTRRIENAIGSVAKTIKSVFGVE